MAQYQHLPIYRLTYELLNRIVVATREFPREYKFTLAQSMKSEVIAMVVLIYRANSTEHKVEVIGEILERLQVVGLLVRLAKDQRILSTKAYASIVEMTESLGKQAQGWKKASVAKTQSKIRESARP
ncbi:MAG: four helix bundle protein [Bdellovibrionales bacterium]|nr:four helix bundle protein [Bdellovibrionales bacterium]